VFATPPPKKNAHQFLPLSRTNIQDPAELQRFVSVRLSANTNTNIVFVSGAYFDEDIINPAQLVYTMNPDPDLYHVIRRAWIHARASKCMIQIVFNGKLSHIPSVIVHRELFIARTWTSFSAMNPHVSMYHTLQKVDRRRLCSNIPDAWFNLVGIHAPHPRVVQCFIVYVEYMLSQWWLNGSSPLLVCGGPASGHEFIARLISRALLNGSNPMNVPTASLKCQSHDLPSRTVIHCSNPTDFKSSWCLALPAAHPSTNFSGLLDKQQEVELLTDIARRVLNADPLPVHTYSILRACNNPIGPHHPVTPMMTPEDRFRDPATLVDWDNQLPLPGDEIKFDLPDIKMESGPELQFDLEMGNLGMDLDESTIISARDKRLVKDLSMLLDNPHVFEDNNPNAIKSDKDVIESDDYERLYAGSNSKVPPLLVDSRYKRFCVHCGLDFHSGPQCTCIFDVDAELATSPLYCAYCGHVHRPHQECFEPNEQGSERVVLKK